ncbi:PREDICTED: peptidyl-prolyl cis-trans isomerase FKBP16-1, chloroplastic isoform X3 [Camelina sativa]|uniref:peptidylprolyl isomerase n=1 Tax=Camelina sativa TaxID=90675 RepID=A0ABM0TZ28_CAMSA|nr:PREDICTED: peptidyl-prolyl cis-trans isomerase FKBP16-1, chloroplastic isoform X3 [Camelina sativa]
MISLSHSSSLIHYLEQQRRLTTFAMAMEIAHRFINSSSMSLSRVGKSRIRNGVCGTARVGLSSVSAVHLPRRRMFMQLAGFGSVLTLLDSPPGLAAPLPDMKDPQVIRTLKLPSGVRFQEIIEGEGPEAREGDLVELNYVCRRANGYFVHSTVDQFSGESSPVKLILDGNDVIEGLKEVLVGMKAGGKRRALIPPSVGYINETLKPIPEEFGPRRSLLSHANEPLVFEIQLLKVL